MKWKIIFLLLISCNLSFAQNGIELVISGQVMNEKGLPLEKANIIDINNSVGVVSSANGSFHLTIPKRATTVKISYIGYSSIVKKITAAELKLVQNDTLFLQFNLKESAVNIDLVEVSAINNELAYDKPNVSILDFEFHQGKLLLLTLQNKQYQLRLVDYTSTTTFELDLEKNFKNFYRDCNDKLHLQSAERSYPIKFLSKSFYLERSLVLDEFMKLASPCVASTEDVLFLHEYTLDNKILLYSTFEKRSKQKQGFHFVINEEQIRGNQDYRIWEIDFYRKKIKKKDAFIMGENSWSDQKNLRIIERNTYYLDKVLKKPDYHPLFKIDNSIYIFDHLIDSMFVYDSIGAYQKRISIDYHNQKNWAEKVMVDYENQNVYALFKSNGYTSLKQINITTGKVTSTIKIERHTFPEKIKIRDGFVYYLFADPYQMGAPKKIYKQALD